MIEHMTTAGSVLSAYHPGLVHDLLQTDAYTDLVIAADGERDPAVLRRRRDLRLQRRLEVFGRDDVRLDVVMGGVALTDAVGPPGVIVEQYRHLCDMSTSPNIRVRVVPPEARVEAGRAAFTLLEFDEPGTPSVVYLEADRADGHVTAYRQAFAALMSQSMPVEEFCPPPL